MEHDRVGEGVVTAGNVDVFVFDPGHVKDARADVMAGDSAHAAVLEVEIAAGFGAPSLDSDDVGRGLFQVLGPFGGGDDHAGGVVGLQAAVQQVGHWTDDPAGVHDVLDGHPLLHHRFGVVASVIAMGHLDVGQVLALHAIGCHMLGEVKCELLDGADQAVGAFH